jgi:hypothetical protein
VIFMLTVLNFGQRRRSGRLVTVAWLLVAGAWGCRPSQPPSPQAEPDEPSASYSAVPFVEAPEAGVAFAYRNGEEAGLCSILESLGGGVGVFDYDRDGLMDLCLPGGGTLSAEKRIAALPAGLFRNLGGFRFAPVAEPSGLGAPKYYSHGAAIGDFDNDGFSDVLITGYGGVQFFQNQGDGTFRETAQACGLTCDRWSSSAAWGDLNGDGNLDVYIANYVNWTFENDPLCTSREGQREICSPKAFEPLADHVFYNNGDGAFRDAFEEAGLRSDGKGLGVVLADMENDGDLDVYVANDTTPNFLYLNDGNGRLREDGLLRGVALDDRGVNTGSMGVDVCDYNRDGLLDLWVANFEDETFALYRNEGQGFFLHVSKPVGVTARGQLFVGFGTVCADFDRDGDEDFVVANGHVIKYPTGAPRRQLPLYLENEGGRFRRLTPAAPDYFGVDHEGRGLATGDLDNDGDLDLAFSNLNDPVALLRNETRSGSWLAVQLIGRGANRDGVGAWLTLQTSSGKIFRQMKGGGSYLSSNDPRVYFGIEDGVRVEKLIIRWPNGNVQTIPQPKLNGLTTIVEPLPDQGA